VDDESIYQFAQFVISDVCAIYFRTVYRHVANTIEENSNRLMNGH